MSQCLPILTNTQLSPSGSQVLFFILSQGRVVVGLLMALPVVTLSCFHECYRYHQLTDVEW